MVNRDMSEIHGISHLYCINATEKQGGEEGRGLHESRGGCVQFLICIYLAAPGLSCGMWNLLP